MISERGRDQPVRRPIASARPICARLSAPVRPYSSAIPVSARNAPTVFVTAKFSVPSQRTRFFRLVPAQARTRAALISSKNTNRLNRSPVRQNPHIAARNEQHQRVVDVPAPYRNTARRTHQGRRDQQARQECHARRRSASIAKPMPGAQAVPWRPAAEPVDQRVAGAATTMQNAQTAARRDRAWRWRAAPPGGWRRRPFSAASSAATMSGSTTGMARRQQAGLTLAQHPELVGVERSGAVVRLDRHRQQQRHDRRLDHHVREHQRLHHRIHRRRARTGYPANTGAVAHRRGIRSPAAARSVDDLHHRQADAPGEPGCGW